MMIGHGAKVAFMFICCMKTIKDVSERFKQELSSLYQLKEIESVNSLILNDLLNISKAKIKAFPELEITPGQTGQLENILNELKTGRPVQYVLGHTEFYGLPFTVNPSVLIPRPETEELVQWVLETVKQSPKPVRNILDIGTGSGCIAITLKKYLPHVKVSALDISSAALETAEQNAELNKAEVQFIEFNILDYNKINYLSEFDLIVSNPPYVTPGDKELMHTNVTGFEPHTALFVPQDDPLLFYNAIADAAVQKLTNGGFLFFEINESYGEQTVQLLKDKLFKNIKLRKDLSGRDRMLKAEYISNSSSTIEHI
jgi:release factor glutamine methyltransferase